MNEQVLVELTELVKYFEGFRARPYVCPAGYWTRGYGTRTTKDAGAITQEDAERELKDELQRLAKRIAHEALNDYEVAALSSLAYNVGLGTVIKGGLYKSLTSGDKSQWYRILLYNKTGSMRLMGLLRRRCAELILAHGGDWREWKRYDDNLRRILSDHKLAAAVGNEIIRSVSTQTTNRAT